MGKEHRKDHRMGVGGASGSSRVKSSPILRLAEPGEEGTVLQTKKRVGSRIKSRTRTPKREGAFGESLPAPATPLSPEWRALFPKKQVNQRPWRGPLKGACFSTSVPWEYTVGTHCPVTKDQ